VRIGVDATCWANGRGYGRFARELLRELVRLAPEHEFVCFGDRLSFESFQLESSNLTRAEVPLTASPAVAASADGSRSPSDMLRLTRAVWRSRPDVFFSPSVYSYFPLPPGMRALVTVHDTLAERYPELTLPTRKARLFWNLKVRVALLQARMILTVSDFAANEIVEVLGVRRERIRVAVEAPAPAYRPSTPAEVTAAATRQSLPAGSRWFSYVGGFNPHKRVGDVIRAHAALSREAAANPPHLLLVGKTSGDAFFHETDRLRALVVEENTGPLVHWTGFVADEELRHLHSGTVALILPSENEGFGLPAIEAAACGAPVVATLQSPLPQLLDGGGFFMRPGDTASLLESMRALLCDNALQQRMGARARERASSLTWAASARSTLAAILEVAA
jgi:glycosyltransferase involved in cell wall biosynthesis